MATLTLTDEDLDRVDALIDEGRGVTPATSALAGLPAEQSEAVKARVLAEEDYDEIAARLSCSPAVVRQRVSRGLRSLKSSLESPI